MNRVFVTTILPEKLISENKLSFAGCNFSTNLISGGYFDKVYSTLPHYVHGEINIKEESYELIYSKLHCISSIFSKISSIHDQWLVFRKIENGTSIWLYNLCQMNFFLVILLRLFKRRCKVNVIELDFTPCSKFSILGLCLYLMNHADGMICLANSRLFTLKNKECLAGVVPYDIKQCPYVEQPTLSFLLSGALSSNISMISDVIEAFKKNPQCILHISGFLDDDSEVASRIKDIPNIIFHGQLPFSDYLALLHSTTFQLSTRDPRYPENTCNFPSKIIEALLHNRAIISTIDYPQLGDLKYLKIDHADMASGISAISKMKDSEMMSYVNQSQRVRELFSPQVWNITMSKIEDNE